MKMNLLNKLVGSFLIIILMMVGLGIFALSQLSSVNESTLFIGQNTVPSITTIDQIQFKVDFYRQQQLLHVISTSTSEMDEIQITMDNTETELDTLFNRYKSTLISNNEEQVIFDSCKTTWQKYVVQSKLFIELSHSLETDKAMTMLHGESIKSFDQLKVNLQDWRTLNQQLANDAIDNVPYIALPKN